MSARAAEARVLRRTRLKLVAWSAGSTFLVLLAMGALLYAATARFLADQAEQQLRQRADLLMISSVASVGGDMTVTETPAGGGPGVVHVLGPDGSPLPPGPAPGVTIGAVAQAPQPGEPDTGPAPFSVPPQGAVTFRVSGDPSQMGMMVGGDLSGTIAVALPDQPVAMLPADAPQPLDAQGFLQARAGTSVINELAVLGAPMYVLSEPVLGASEPFVIQVGYDRTTELRTLEGLALVLGVAGLGAVLVAAAFGWLYAGRALVPVRDSLRRQRELAADASHELRTPLTVIRGNLELLRAGAPAAPVQGEPGPLDEIDAEVDRMSVLVDQMLLLARADSDALELANVPADLGAEAADAVESLAPVAAMRAVELLLDVEPAPLTGDPARLRQLAAILVDNAIRHAPPGGHVRVTVRSHADHATLAVTDDGPGIRSEDLPHVFDRFWRAADAPNGGSGLGLAIAKWVADAHGGTITAAVPPDGGAGARFEVRLPAR